MLIFRPFRVACMKTYYFDLKNGIPLQDRIGLRFAVPSQAIEHSKTISLKLRSDSRISDPHLCVLVFDEAGREMHRERVFPDGTVDGVTKV